MDHELSVFWCLLVREHLPHPAPAALMSETAASPTPPNQVLASSLPAPYLRQFVR